MEKLCGIVTPFKSTCFFFKTTINAYKLLRDHVVLAVMIETGLRRAEVAGLTWAMIQQRDGS